MKELIMFLSIFFSAHAFGQYLKSGQWQGEIHYSQQKVPFTFEVDYPNGEVPQITFINGKERRIISEIIQNGDSLVIPIKPFDVVIKAQFTEMKMVGTYEKCYLDIRYTFTATFGKPRMIKRSLLPSIKSGRRWSMTFNPEASNMFKGVGLFKQMGHTITGTVMTQVSDYRYFEGIMDGDSIKLSCFDGAHAFLILGKKTENGWSGKMIYDDNYSEPWMAIEDSNAELENPFEMVEIERGKHKPFYDLLGAGSGKRSVDPDKYAGKVLVIQLFGTWCPNSHDQTNYLVDWYEKNKEKKVSILAVSYEANYSQEYGLRRIKEYKESNEISYEVVLGGRLSKTSAAIPFPFMESIEAFPTLVIVDKEGFVRYVHSYFNGPATGEYYEQFDQHFNEIIEKLIAE